MALPFEPTLSRQVKTDVLEPHQQTTSVKLKTACDFHQRYMLKHPFLSDFHCPAELLHACLLEGDPSVTSYVPQPFRLRVRRHWYIPDCYVVSNHNPRRVLELRPYGEMPEDLRIPLIHFFAQHGMQFEVISNESVFERKIEAENWLEIVTILYLSRDLTTTDTEQTVLETLFKNGPCTLGDLIDPGDRERTYFQEIALLRLLHQGHVRGDLTAQALDYDTGLSLCA